MTGILERNHLRGSALRWLVWGGAAALLLLPLVAMQFTREVDWNGFDFLVMGVMLLAACLAYEAAVRVATNNAYMLAAGLAAGGAFLMTWANLAVGIIGNEGNPANDLFFGVVAVLVLGTLLARLQPRGMAGALVVTAIAQVGAGLYTWLAGDGHVFVFTGVMCALWLASAHLFRLAAAAKTGSGSAIRN